MANYKDIKATYTCPAACPENVFMDRIYSFNKDNKGLYFTDGNYVEYAEEWYIKMLFSPQDKEITWNDVEFTDEVKQTKTK